MADTKAIRRLGLDLRTVAHPHTNPFANSNGRRERPYPYDGRANINSVQPDGTSFDKIIKHPGISVYIE